MSVSRLVPVGATVSGNKTESSVRSGCRAFSLIFGLTLVAFGWANASALAKKKPPPQQGLDAAVAEVIYFNFGQAYKLFKSVLEKSLEGSASWQQAVYGTGMCAHQISPPTESRIQAAEKLYKLLIKKCPDSKFAPRAMMNLGRIAELSDYHGDKVDLQAARNWYQKVVTSWPKKPIAGEATLRIAGTYIQTYKEAQVREGVALLEDWLRSHPQDELASAMWQYLGDTYFFPLADYAKSLDCYEKADAIGLIEKGREGPVYWRMAVMADRFLKDRRRAVKYYTKIVKVVPTSGKAYEAQSALKRLGAPVPELEVFEKLMAAHQEFSTKAEKKDAAK